MRAALFIAAGFAAGFIVALRFRPTTDTSCCRRVAAGVRDRVGAACGPVCQSIGDSLGIWGSTPDLLDRFGL